MPIALVTALISAGGLIIGSVIGGICSWFISKFSMHEQIRIQKENLNYQERCKSKEKYTNANIIRLDFCNAIYQSIRYLRGNEENKFFYNLIPVYKDYHKIIASLCDEYSLKELSYIYQFYCVLEESAMIVDKGDNKELYANIDIRNAYKSILEKVYGENHLKVLSKDINDISYEQLYNDPLMKEGYRDILKSLDEICRLGYEAKKMER